MAVIPVEHPIDLHSNLRQLAMGRHGELLYGKHMTYSSSLLRKCAKLYKDTSITIDNQLAKLLRKYAVDPNTPEIEDIFPR